MCWACYCTALVNVSGPAVFGLEVGTEVTSRNFSKVIKEAEKEKHNNLYIFVRLILQVLAIDIVLEKRHIKVLHSEFRTKLLRRLAHSPTCN